MNSSYVLDTSAFLNLIRGKELGEQIDRAYGLRQAMHRHTVSIVTHAELAVLADRNGWGATRRKALKDALEQVVTVNIESQALVDAYIRIAAACQTLPGSDHVMGNNDMWIAATAFVSGLALITTDKDFNHLNGSLITVHWVDPEIGKPATA